MYTYKISLIEDGQILFIKHSGNVTVARTRKSLNTIFEYLEKSPRIVHLISDMSDAVLLSEAEGIILEDIVEKIEKHPKLGIQIIVTPPSHKDRSLEKTLNEYNVQVSREKLLSPNGEYKRSVIFFDSVEEAKAFLLIYNQTWDDPE